MKIRQLFWLTLILFQSYPIISVAEIYKWTDEFGRVYYGEKPPAKEKSDTVDLKKGNVIGKFSGNKDAKTDVYKRDRFYMPVKKSTVPYRFTLTSKIKNNEPVDRLKAFTANQSQKKFYVHIRMPGVERSKSYTFRSRIIDAKGELLFDKATSVNSTTSSIFMLNSYEPKPATDAPGRWTFQGILNGEALYTEKRYIKFKTPEKPKTKKPKTSTNPPKLPPRDKIKLANGELVDMPLNEKEIDDLVDKVKSMHSYTYSRGTEQSKSSTSQIKANSRKNNQPCKDKRSVGCSENKPVVSKWASTDSSHKNTNLSTKMDADYVMPTSATLYKECNEENIKPGTSRSSLCDYWDQHLKYINQRMAKECKGAGEKIYKTATNVEGIFLNRPLTDPDSPRRQFKNNILHQKSTGSINSAYVSPRTGRLYRQFEYYDKRKKAYSTLKITSISKGKRIADVKTSITGASEPQSRFEVSYEHLTTKEDHSQGLYGDRTWIVDRETGDLMAERIVYYFTVQNATAMKDGTGLRRPGKYSKYEKSKPYFFPCKNYVPRITRFEEEHPVDEYEFVSRVLEPVPFTQQENIFLYDFAIGGGLRSKECVGMQSLGPGINPSDLVVERVNDDLKLSLKGKVDTFTCRYFFVGPHWSLKLLFSDGGMWDEPRVLGHGNVKRVKND
jgi:uncharacterized protein DUF4124